jgi:hypothetical protein
VQEGGELAVTEARARSVYSPYLLIFFIDLF